MKEVNENYEKALELERSGSPPGPILESLMAAADEGCSDAKYALGTLYLHGKYVAPDSQVAIDFLRDASDEMHPAALFDLGVALEKGDVVKRNLREAFRCYFLSMTFGDRDAIYEVARCLYYGIGTRRNRSLYKTVMVADDFVKRLESAE